MSGRKSGDASSPRHAWAFVAGMRRGAFGWRGSGKAVARLKLAVSEIRAVERADPVAAGEGVIRLAERIWPAFEQVDTSSGALGSAVNRTLETLVPLLIAAPADQPTRAKWLERLFDAIQDDGVDYLLPLAERFGAIAVFPELADRWADETIGTVRLAWSEPGGHAAATPVCLSCLLEAGRHDDLAALLALQRFRWWDYDRFAAESLLRQGRPEEALALAESLLKESQQGYGQGRIARFCEEVLLGLGRADEAYRRFGLPHAAGATYLATWRALARRYPYRPAREVLGDLIAAHGQPGKWFAAAKAAGALDVALACAAAGDADPRTLIRAARDFAAREPRFAAQVALQAVDRILADGGFQSDAADATAAVTHLLAAARRIGAESWANEAVARLIDARATPSAMAPAVRAALAAGAATPAPRSDSAG